MLLAIIDHGGVRYYLLELIISTFDYVESHIQILLDIFIFYVLYVYLFTSTKCQLYIFDIPKIKLYAAHTCINMAQILIPMFQFLCVWKLLKQIVYCLWCCKLAWLKFEIEPLVLIFCIYMYIHMYIYPSQCIVYNN